MINVNKTTDFNKTPQIAGVMPGDSSIEFVGIRKTKQVLWLQNGSNHYFKDLPERYYALLETAYLNDEKAVQFISELTNDLQRQVELYTYYCYGEVDGTADIKNGELSPSENFRDQENCPSLLWNSKHITIDDHVLTPRQLIIVDAIGNDLPDKAIADLLGISQTTLDFHKKKLYEAIGVQTKIALLKKAFQEKVIQ